MRDTRGMGPGRFQHGIVSAGAVALVLVAAAPPRAGAALQWQTVVNNTHAVPTATGKTFNSYNQPSVNNSGLVVFRARSQGGSGQAGGGQPATGVFTRDMSAVGAPIGVVAVRGSVVPGPNNITKPGPATFNEFPSIPRIDATSSMIATRGQSQPVLEYQTGWDGTTQTPLTTKGGTSGVYTNPSGPLQTGMSGLGNVTNTPYPANPDLSYFQVPKATPGSKFDQFPGAPSATGGDTLVFKGNWTDSVTGGGKTGVYFRNVTAGDGKSPVQLIADSNTVIPGFTGTTFGSTAPPSAADGRMVFLGLDNEAAPTKGGIYAAAIDNTKNPDTPSVLQTIVSVGQAVVGKVGEFFTRLGEALSFDGRFVAFWGAWGSEDASGNLVTDTRAVTVDCSSLENEKTKAFCIAQDNGTTAGSGTAGDGLYTFDVPVDQGFFITDVNNPSDTRLIEQTGGAFLDFVYWNFSGKVPGLEGEADGEPARWRSTSFIAADGWNAVFKGTQTSNAGGHTGLYLATESDPLTIAETGMDGSLIDAMAVDSSGKGLPIVSVGIERDGFRNGWLAITASMTDGVTSMAGIYLTQVPEPRVLALMLGGLLLLALRSHRHVPPQVSPVPAAPPYTRP